MSLRALIFAYYFPPSAGPGVRRTVRFVKELPGLGVEPTVVTVDGRTFANREEFGLDEAALAEIPDAVRVERTPAWTLPRTRWLLMRLKLMRLALTAFYPLFWERQALWVLPAIRRGLRLIREQRPDVIYTSTGPFCTNVIGLALRRLTGIPWVTDYRDLWTGSWVKWWPTRIHHELERGLERWTCATADRIVANTPTARDALLRDFPGTDPRRVVVVTNGWDDHVEPAGVSGRGEDRVVLLHAGSFDARAGEDAREGGRSWRGRLEYRLPDYDLSTHGPGTLFAALDRLNGERPDLAGQILLRLVGSIHESWPREAERLGIGHLVEFTGSVPFAESRRLQLEADLLLMTTVSRRDGRPVPRVNAKLYEYFRAGKPILLLSDEGDAASFARRAGLGIVLPPKDVDAVVNFLRRLAEDPDRTLGLHEARPEGIEPFSSRSLASRLVRTFEAAVADRADPA